MKKDWVLEQEDFDRLLDWLDRDRDAAGQKYETIRLRLVKIFARRGCLEADDLADETINRVTTKVATIAATYEGQPALYFYGIAQMVHLEYLRRPRATTVPESLPISLAENNEQEYECLDRCLERLAGDQRELVTQYYQNQRAAKIEHRRQLAKDLGIAVNALRIRAHRIRSTLLNCLKECLGQ